MTGGAGRTRGARSPLCTRRGSGLAAAGCSPPGTSAHLREGLTWAGRPSSSRAVPPPGHRPCPPGARPPSPARPALAMSRAAGSGGAARLLAIPGPGPGPKPPPARADSERRAPRPRPARSAAATAAAAASPLPPAPLKAPSGDRAGPPAAGEGLTEEGAPPAPAGPHSAGTAAAAPARSAQARAATAARGGRPPRPRRAQRPGAETARETRDTAVQTEMGVRGTETLRHSVRENPPGAETPAWREKFPDGNSETRDPEPGTRRVTEPSEMRREEGRRDKEASTKPRRRWLWGSDSDKR